MKILGLALLLTATGVLYFYFYPDLTQTEQVRYRLTTTVDTPNGPRRGTGVWGYSMAATYIPLNSLTWEFAGRVEGEAIPVDLGDGRTLYVVLGGRVPPKDLGTGLEPPYFSAAFMNASPKYRLEADVVLRPAYFGSGHSGATKDVEWIKAQRGRTVSLECGGLQKSLKPCPAMVLANRSGSNVTLLDPDDFAATLGAGYRLRSITMQVVDDPITRGIERRLPWVKPLPYQSLKRQDELRAMGFSRREPARYR